MRVTKLLPGYVIKSSIGLTIQNVTLGQCECTTIMLDVGQSEEEEKYS
jgi:hypothetical protein